MPFYPELNLLFIHIPKTGGTSVENYIEEKFNFPNDSFHMFNYPNIKGHRRQHCTYAELQDEIETIEKYKAFAIVRNPLHRIISEVLYLKKYWKIDISGNTLDEKIKYLLETSEEGDYDNHIIPQYKYLLDKNGDINKNIYIMYNETLNQDMKRFGYMDFTNKELISEKFEKNYDELVNKETKKLVYEYYKLDYILFYQHLKI